MDLLRDRLLAGRRIALAGGLSDALSGPLRELGAELEELDVERIPAEEDRVGEWARERLPLHALVYCAHDAFGAGGQEGLDASLEQAWVAVREVAVGALIERAGGKLLLIAPRPDAGPLAGAARAGLENLVRTVSVEWARHGVTAVLIAPGPATSDAELAALVSFLVSEGGDYLSGCRLELGAAR
jgi:NAD(P)-dependent dehydrogenase (short-subunit alcohol dehydrogenase family)